MSTSQAHELGWLRSYCVWGIILNNVLEALVDKFEDDQAVSRARGCMHMLSLYLMPTFFWCNAEVALGSTEPCSYTQSSEGSPSKIRQILKWYYTHIVMKTSKSVGLPFLGIYLLVGKIHLFLLSDGTKTFWDFYLKEWSLSYAWCVLYLLSMFWVNGFYLGCLGGEYAFTLSMGKVVFFVVPLMILYTGSVALTVAASAATAVPYLSIYLSSRFLYHGGGGLVVCWINIFVLFLCSCLVNFLTHESLETLSSPLLRWICMNHYFVLGMLCGTMLDCHGQHRSWVRGLGLMALCTLAVVYYPAADDKTFFQHTVAAWTWTTVLRCLARSVFADFLKQKKTLRIEKFVRKSWLLVYLIHPPVVDLVVQRIDFSGWGILPAASAVTFLTVLLSLLILAVGSLVIYKLTKQCKKKRQLDDDDNVKEAYRRGSSFGMPIAGIKSQAMKLAEKSPKKKTHYNPFDVRRTSIEPQRLPPLNTPKNSPEMDSSLDPQMIKPSKKTVSFDEPIELPGKVSNKQLWALDSSETDSSSFSSSGSSSSSSPPSDHQRTVVRKVVMEI